ncbi:hypothetical protein [Nonomuraea sp. JJY05]|jgi:multiple sugar transport system substrate-binding protein|uniref:hypothetical protein n=1 Tax=Nonomuraea sp. JJY05 TaxID=3350255 RepID=UPI00373E0C3A
MRKLAETDKATAEYLDTTKVGQAPRVTNGAGDLEAIVKRHPEEVLFDREPPAQAARSFSTEPQAETDGA